mgnify:CR=1 FL=1|jgi:hypothetical protein|tara:strand:+ start:445 stop:777 length:333 start_codon:yes stop_codon:yes gene_type:complete
MFNKKILISLTIFSVMMFFTSTIKNQSRLMEKEILTLQKKISLLQNDLHVSQLDYYYLSSPASLKEKLSNYEDIDYKNMNYSNLYFGIDHYIKDQKKITQNLKNDKKVKK